MGGPGEGIYTPLNEELLDRDGRVVAEYQCSGWAAMID